MSHLQIIQSKVLQKPELEKKLANWRLKTDRVVFTNGCFDILHKGHITYLSQAADLGNRLVIGLNNDQSVKALEKGPSRPVNSEFDRAFVLAALHFVDAVILFGEDTPLDLISWIKPEVLVKGGDYDAGETDPNSSQYIVGSDLVKKHGGKVDTIPFVKGYSTTKTIEKTNS